MTVGCGESSINSRQSGHVLNVGLTLGEQILEELTSKNNEPMKQSPDFRLTLVVQRKHFSAVLYFSVQTSAQDIKSH
jgi:hypothetical protein